MVTSLNRAQIAQVIAERLERDKDKILAQWRQATPVAHAIIDDLLPDEFAKDLASQFPPLDSMMLRSSARERKRVGVAVDKYHPVVQETLFAFQNPRIIAAVTAATGLPTLQPDPSLYAAGLSAMGKDDFLNPHLDNSHDGDIKLYRAVNILFYVSPGWKPENGGSLELWDNRVKHPVAVPPRFNRLVLMQTNTTSWHSVSRVKVDQPRYCYSNYYFSAEPPGGRPYRHVTTFTGRPEEPLKRAVLAVTDGLVLNFLGRNFPALTQRSKHRITTKPPV